FRPRATCSAIGKSNCYPTTSFDLLHRRPLAEMETDATDTRPHLHLALRCCSDKRFAERCKQPTPPALPWPRAYRAGYGTGVEPRWEDTGHRIGGPHGPPLGCNNREAVCYPIGTHRSYPDAGLESG